MDMGMVLELLKGAAAFMGLISVIVVVHEFGHYLIARWAGVGIHAFSVGFGPELYGWTDKHGTRWRLSLLPLGGYVKMVHENPAVEAPEAQSVPGKFFMAVAPGWRLAICLAGPVFSLVFGAMLMVGIRATTVQESAVKITSTVAGSPAAADILPDDVLQSWNGTPVKSLDDIPKDKEGGPVTLSLLRHGQPVTVTIPRDPVTGHLGVNMESQTSQVFMPEKAGGLKEGVDAAVSALGMQVNGLWQAVSGAPGAQAEVGGPVSVAVLSLQAFNLGWASYLWLMGFLSCVIGAVNLLPLGGLDGGQSLVHASEMIGLKWPDWLLRLYYNTGMFAVLALMGYALLSDGMRFFAPLKASADQLYNWMNSLF